MKNTNKYLKREGTPGTKRSQVNYTAAELREKRRHEAEVRQEIRDEMGDAKQLKLLQRRGHTATRERTRLEKKLAKVS